MQIRPEIAVPHRTSGDTLQTKTNTKERPPVSMPAAGDPVVGDAVLRQSVTITFVETLPTTSSLWPPSDARLITECHGGSKATVKICESRSIALIYAQKYVDPDIKGNPAEWRLEQSRLENDLKTYQSLDHMALRDSFGGLHHHGRSDEDGLVLYLEYAGSTVLANHVMSDTEMGMGIMQSFFGSLTVEIMAICEVGVAGDEATQLRKKLFSDRIVNRLAPKSTDLAKIMPNGDSVLLQSQLQHLKGRWEACYTQLEPLLTSGAVASLPTDTTFLNMILNPDTGTVKCIDPGKIDRTAAAYPLSKMLVFGPYYRFVNDKEFQITADGFCPTVPANVSSTHKVLAACQGILETVDAITASQTIVAGLIQFGGDLGYRYNLEDVQSKKIFADLSLFDRALTHLEGLMSAVFGDLGMSPTSVLSTENCQEFAEKFVAQRARQLSAEVALLLPVKEGL